MDKKILEKIAKGQTRKKWTDKERATLIACRQAGLFPSTIYDKNLLPGRSRSQIGIELYRTEGI